MVLDNYNFQPEGEWKWSLTGFTLGTMIGLGITPFLPTAMIFGTLGGTISWILCFYDENF